LNGQLTALLVGCAVAVGAAAEDLVPYRVDGDEIRAPLMRDAGDAARGREIVFGRESNCLLCHTVPDAGTRPMGNIGPSLGGVGARLNAGELRLRIVDSRRVSPDTSMPAYYRVQGLNWVAAPYRGKPILTAREVEDVVAYLKSLR
jgi:sulfur-oxidizing protein SoxX